MKLHRIVADLDDSDYVTLARSRTLVRRLFNLNGMPTNSQVVSWMLRSIPWGELESQSEDGGEVSHPGSGTVPGQTEPNGVAS